MARCNIIRLIMVSGALGWLTACAQTPADAGAGAQPLAAPIAEGSLMGSTPAVLNAEFGQPVLRRIDGTSQVWLYHSSVCGLNLILFPDSSGTPRVASAVPDSSDPTSCFASLQREAALERPTSS